MHARWPGTPHTVHALEHQRLSGATGRDATVAPGRHNRGHPGSGPAVSDSYYELIDAAGELGEKFVATDMVRSTWSAAIQHAAPVSEVVHASAPPLRPVAEARGRDMKKDWDRNYVHSLDWRWLTKPMSDGPGESWIRPEVDLVKGETMTALERLFAVADDANGIGTKLDIRRWTFLNTDLVVHIHRVPDGEWIGIRAETNYGPDGIGTTIGTLFDERGAIGGIQQSVLVRPRPPKR